MWGIDYTDPKIIFVGSLASLITIFTAGWAGFKFIIRPIRKRILKKRTLAVLKEKSIENLETIKNFIKRDGYKPYSISRTDELNQLSSTFTNRRALKILIHGEMGCGKSGMLRHLAEINLIKNIRILFINCRNYTAITDGEDLVKKLDLEGKSLSEVLDKTGWPKFTFLDSLDEIARWPAAFAVIYRFLESAAKARTILLCTCRTKDYEENETIKRLSWDENYLVPNPNETQVKTILENFGITSEIPQLTYDFIQNLFFLDKFVNIYEEGINLSAITTRTAILEDYCKNAVLKTRLGRASKSKKKEIVNAVIERIETTNSFRVNEDAVICASGGASRDYDESANELISLGLILRSGGFLSFTHILLLEQVMTNYYRTLIEEGLEINGDRIKSIVSLDGGKPLFVQLAALRAFAGIEYPDEEMGTFLTETFRNNRPLLIYFFEEPEILQTSWLDYIGEDVLSEVVTKPRSYKELETFLNYLLSRPEKPTDKVFEYLFRIAELGSMANYRIMKSLKNFKPPDAPQVKELAKKLTESVIDKEFFEYIDALNESDPTKGAEFLQEVIKKQVERETDHFFYWLQEPLNKYLEHYPEEYFEPIVRSMETSLETKHPENDAIKRYEDGQTTCISFGDEMHEEEGKGRKHIGNLPELLQIMVENHSARIARENPKLWRRLLPVALEKDYALSIYFTIKAMLPQAGEYKDEIHKISAEEKYLGCYTLEYVMDLAVRSAYPHWAKHQKITWARKVSSFVFYAEDSSRNNELRMDRLAAVKAHDRIPSLANRIEYLEKNTGKPAPEEPIPLIWSTGVYQIVAPLTVDKLKTMPLEEIITETRSIMAGRVEKYDFHSRNIHEYGNELAKLVATDPKKYEPVVNVVADERQREKVVKEMVTSFVCELEKSEIPPAAKLSILRNFIVYPSSSVKRWVASNFDKIIPACSEDQLNEIENVLTSYADDPHPPEGWDASKPSFGPLGTGINSTRGVTLIALVGIYKRRPKPGKVKDAIHKLIEDPHPGVRACALWNIHQLMAIDKEFAKEIGIHFLKEKDLGVRAEFLGVIPLFYQEYNNLKERIIKFIDEAANDENIEIRKRAFRLLVSGYDFDEAFEPFVMPRLFGKQTKPEFREVGADRFTEQILQRSNFEKYYGLIIKLAQRGDEDVLKECFRLLSLDQTKVEEGEIEPDDILFPRINELLKILVDRLSSDDTYPREYWHAKELFDYLGFCGFNTKYSNEVIDLFETIRSYLNKSKTLQFLSELIRESVHKTALSVNIDVKHKRIACALLEDIARLAGDSTAHQYWLELGCSDL